MQHISGGKKADRFASKRQEQSKEQRWCSLPNAEDYTYETKMVAQ